MNLDRSAVLGEPERANSRRAGIIAAYLALGALALSPLLWARIPPLVDYPNHLARMSVLARLGANAGPMAGYVAHWRLLPNLAMDLIVPPLSRLMPLEDAGRLFIALTMALLVLGAVSLNRVLWGRIALWPVCSLLFVYNKVLWWGFLNYLFGLGVALLCFSAWIGSERWRPALRLAIFAALASLLFVLHLFALGVYGLLVLSWEAGNRFAQGRWRSRESITAIAFAAAQFILPALLWLASLRGGGPTYTAYADLTVTIDALLAPTAFGMPPSLFDFTLLILSLAFLLLASRRGILQLAPSMRLPVAMMIVVSLLMPEWLSGSWGAHLRLPVALPFVVIGSLRLDASHRLPIARLGLLALLLLGTRVWAVSQSWREMDGRVAALRAAIQGLPEGTRLLPVLDPMPPSEKQVPGVPMAVQTQALPAYFHIGAVATIDRAAFLPGLFTGWYPLEPSPRNAGLSRLMRGIVSPDELIARASPESVGSLANQRDFYGDTPCCLDWPATYDFVLWIDFGRAPQPLPEPLADRLQPWGGGSFFHLYRVVRP